MAWTLEIWNANRSTLLNTITHAAAGGIEDGFTWQLKGNGDTVQLDMQGVNNRVKMAPRSVVKLFVDGVQWFHGVCPDPPSASSLDSEKMQVLGGREALRKTLMDGQAYRNTGVYAIVRDVLARLIPPALTYDSALIPGGNGPVLDTYYAPTATLEEVLDALAKSAGLPTGVDRQGRVFLGGNTGTYTTTYAGKGWKVLRVQGRETVTKAVLRVVTSHNTGQWGDAQVTYGNKVPKTVTTVAMHASHALHRAEQGVSVPEGVSVVALQPPSGTADSTGVDGSATMDGDPDTFTDVPLDVAGTTQIFLAVSSAASRPIGAEIEYETLYAADAPDNPFEMRLQMLGGGNSNMIIYPAKTSGRQSVRVILPPDVAAGATWTGRVTVRPLYVFDSVATRPDAKIRVFEVRFLHVDEAAATTLAQSFLQVPFASPAQVDVPGLIAPQPQATVTGTPTGDVTGGAPLWEYTHTMQDGKSTRIRIGSDGQSDTARAIKWAVQR